MASFEAVGEESNPYKIAAVSSAGENWAFGFMRVEPPFLPGKEMLRQAESDMNVSLKLMGLDRDATLLMFRCGKRKEFTSFENEYRVRTTAEHLLTDLGLIASSDIFINYFNVEDKVITE